MMTWTFGGKSPVRVSSYDLASVGHVSYLIVDEASRTAAVVDPQPDIDPYLEGAGRSRARIRHVFLTQLHSDFEGGQGALAERTGAVVYVGARARPAYAHLPLKDGDVFQFGAVGLRVLETPGHALEGISILAADARAPWGLFSGDLLFEGDLGRPEPRLNEGLSAADMAERLLETIRKRILALPEGLRVFSGHRAAAPGEPPSLGALRKSNPLLRRMPAEAFVRTVTAGMLPRPLRRGTRNGLNRGGRPEPLPPHAPPSLPASVFLSALERGAVALDVREPMEFAAAHLRGSLSLGLGGRLEEWAAAVLDPTEEYVLIANPGSEEEAAERLRPLLGARIRGCLAGGMTSLEPRPGLLARATHALIPAGRKVLTARVDVRSADRSERGGGRRLPLEELLGRLDEVPVGGSRLAVTDEDPYRAHSAASLLRRRGWAEARPLIACPR